MLEFKYPGDRRNPSFAVQYYEKFVKGKNLPTPLTEDNLPQPLPETIEELLTLLQNAKKKTKKEEYEEILKSKYPDIDLTNLNEDYLSWLHQRYIENKTKSGEIVHPIEEALVTLGKFPSIQNKYKTSAEFKEKVEKAGYNEEAGYKDISSIQNLTLDQMEKIISLDISRPSIKVEGVEIKEEEFLGKFGEWNLWIPHTKETSAKIAGYDEDYNPKTDWCTGRTRGSNLFYSYIGRGDIPAFLFYIIKDNPSDDEDWLSLGYISHGNILAPDFSGEYGGLSVNRVNEGLTEYDYSRILGDSWNSIKLKIEEELEKHKVVEGGEEKYVSPARSLIKAMAKNVEEFKKELHPKSNAEKKDFIKVIMDSDPSEDVLKVCGNTLARIDPKYFLGSFSDKPWAKDYLKLAAEKLAEIDPRYFLSRYSYESWAKDYLKLAAEKLAEIDPRYFLSSFSDKPWAEPYIDLAAEIVVEKDPKYFLNNFSNKSWAEAYIGLAAKILAEKYPEYFLSFSYKPWAKPDLIDLAAKILAEKYPEYFLEYFSDKPWAKSHHIELAKSKLNIKQASNPIQNKLLKLSNFLKSNNLKEYKNIREIM
jgi:ribosomal protein S17E